ncbi:MAG: BatD family protein, partial [Gemmatimonadota bacterium]|nr:BatD family protein [Gemmatimonadota bacterium]
MRLRALPFVAGLLCAAPLPLAAQAPRIVAALDPDTVQVGETFTVGVVVTQEGDGEVRFPAALPLDEDLEQRGPVRIRSLEGGSEWRAYYTVVAWRADTLPIPPIELTSAATGSATLSVTPPRVVVRSVLPDVVSDLELREAKPFLRIRSFPWWVLLLLAAAAAL